MAEVIYWARLTDLSPAVQALPATADTLMILERLPVVWLDDAVRENGLRFARFDPQEPFNQWERGRIFNPQGELRWERLAGHFQTVYAGSKTIALPPEFQRDESLPLEQTNTRSFYLWGKRLTAQALATLDRPPTDHLFAEYKVGGILSEYPLPNSSGDRVKLEMIEYLDPDSRALLYYRFKGVITV